MCFESLLSIGSKLCTNYSSRNTYTPFFLHYSPDYGLTLRVSTLLHTHVLGLGMSRYAVHYAERCRKSKRANLEVWHLFMPLPFLGIILWLIDRGTEWTYRNLSKKVLYSSYARFGYQTKF